MSRHTTGGYSYQHAVREIGQDHYRLSWVVDFYYPRSRLRHPRRFERDTDEKGMRAFCKKWSVTPRQRMGTNLAEPA